MAPSPTLTPRLLALLALTTFLAATTLHYHTPMLGTFAAEFEAAASEVGWVATLTFGGFLAGFVFIAPLGDRFDKRRVILVQHALLIVALLVEAAAPNLATLVAAGFAIGLCASLSQSIVPLVAELASPQERGKTLGTLLSALFLGILFGRLAGGFVTARFGWRWMFVAAALLLAALAPVLVARLPRTPAKTKASYGELLGSIVKLVRSNDTARRVFAVQLLLGITYGGFWATVAPMLHALYGLGPTAAGAMGIPGAAGILVARPAGRWMDRIGSAPVVSAGIAVVIAAWLVFALGTWWLVALVAGAILFDCGLRAAMVANQTTVNSIAPEARSRGNTVFGVAVWGGNAVGSLAATFALTHAGWLAVCGIALLAGLAALGVQRFFVRRRGSG